MSQTILTDFFSTVKHVQDHQTAKKRKISLDFDEDISTEYIKNDVFKENIMDDVKLNEECNADTERTFGSVITSTIDNHSKYALKEDRTPCTPSTTDEGKNQKTRKRDREETEPVVAKEDWTPKINPDNQLFTVGTNSLSVAKKKLDMGQEPSSAVPPRVTFHKLGVLSPKKNTSVQNSPGKVDFDKLELKLTPQKKYTTEVVKTPSSVSKDLFPKEVVKTSSSVSKDLFSSVALEESKETNVGSAIKEAQSVKSKMTPSEVKHKLGNVKLADLRNRLAAINSSSLSAKASAAKGSKIKEKSSSILLEVEIPKVPCSPIKQPTTPIKANSAVKASPRKVPAYQRYHSLTQPVNKTLPIPYNYRMLGEMFRSMDTVVSMMYNRKEVITMDKLTKSVKQMMRRPFLSSHIGQIRCLFPQAYSFTWEKPTRGFSGDLEIQIRPNLRYKKALLEEFDKDGIVPEKMLAEQLVERRGMFHNVLVQLVKDHHSDFLKTLDPPISVVDSKITAWHKEFDVDSCPDVDTVSLPTNPNEIKIAAPEDILARLNSVVVSNDKDTTKDALNNDKPVTVGQLTPVKEALSSLPPALLAKIRAKEAARAVQLMTRSPEQIAKIKQLKRLPELARMTRNLLIQEKKAALTVEFTCRKLVESLVPKTDKIQVEGDLRAMCVETKGWMTVHMVGQAEYFKVGKTDINKVCERLERKLKELEEK